MNKKVLISILLIACVVSASFVALRLFASSTTEHQTIYVEPAFLQVTPCTNFTVEVKVRDVINLYAYQFHLYWNCNLWCVECKATPPWTPNIIVKDECNNTGKYYWCAVAALVPAPPFNGTTTLARLTFHCEGPGNCTLSLKETELVNPDGMEIPHTVEDGYVTQGEACVYRYKVKFECGWQRVEIKPLCPCVTSEMITVETFTTTHINVYNPNHRIPVNVTKYFVRVFPEDRPYFGGHTNKTYAVIVPPNKGFEIDCEDVQSWPYTPDPDQPLWLLCESFWKGYVIIECALPPGALPLEVVAVYNKESADMVDKITFHVETHWCNCINTSRGMMKLHEPHELSVIIPWEPDNITLPALVKRELGIVPPFEPEDIDIEIESTTTYFDFLNCSTKERIVFIPRATSVLWKKALDEMWPVEMRPPGFVWPDWIWPCKIYEMKKTEKFHTPWQEVIVDPEANIRDYMTSTLIDLGVPENITRSYIMPAIRIEILDIDVGKGVGTSMDVEYIKPEIVTIGS